MPLTNQKASAATFANGLILLMSSFGLNIAYSFMGQSNQL